MKKIKRFQYPLIFSFFTFHFLMCALSMAKINSQVWPAPIRPFISVYSHLTGSGAGFGFFSPAIPKEVSIEFDIETSDHALIHTTLQSETVPEVSFRVGNMIRLVNRHFYQKKIMRSLAASLSSSMFERYPAAKTVTLRTFIYDFPSLPDAQKGKIAQSKEVYSVKFGRTL